ncbi:DUF488 domain-containing protein [Serpens gallinarum]|jgi:uncharacterized protein YeaO (DUF488 family)|uniref:DUF488 domain-containing protein n=1 Tax=Serpens gallinarum TaxID=2763075 RepID=A0ABR8TS51_9PSED|nr:DUF488 domain-containing protein [Serpens gallinarum]MBD7978607.1 DUF488 domain-containing protein [Serpens gallinarum]
MIQCKRVYAAAVEADGYRVLIDRLWPRGIKKEALRLDAWLKDVAPSTALRQAFDHDPAQFPEFERRYRAELAAHPEHWWTLLEQARSGHLTLLFAAKDEAHNNAQVLAGFLEDELERQGPSSSPPCYAHEETR